MKTTTFENKVNKFNEDHKNNYTTSPISKRSVAYRIMLDTLAAQNKERQYPNISSRNRTANYIEDCKYICNELNIKCFKFGHDYDRAPKGGILGQYIKLK